MPEQKNISDILYENISRTSVSTLFVCFLSHIIFWRYNHHLLSACQCMVCRGKPNSFRAFARPNYESQDCFFSGGIIKDILLRKNIYRFQLSICKLINKGKKQVSLNLAVHTANSISGFIKK